MRYDLAFFLCCCKSFLGSDPEGSENFYELLGVDRDASPEEIKRAYKRQSLQMHPDKLAQRGLTVTDADQAKFTRMKEAYEVLSDQHKRDTYDAIGERGMKWIEEPFSIDPQELAHNFATSSVLDRSKVFAIFVAVAVAVLILPVLICLHVDGRFGPDASWLATLTPLWIWDTFILFYHSRVIMMGEIKRPDTIPEQDWVDPLPMKKRVVSMLRFMLIVLFEIFVALQLDHIVNVRWTIIFIPLYVWEGSTLYKKWPLARMRIVTVEDLETALGKPFSQFTAAEKELIGSRYSVVPSTSSPEFEAAQRLKTRARHDVIKSVFRILFVMVLLVQLDGHRDWNWWLVFLPFWIMTGLICYANYQAFAEVQHMAAEKDPALFGLKTPANAAAASAAVPPTGAGVDAAAASTTSYGAIGKDGNATSDETRKTQEAAAAAAGASSSPPSNLTDEQREELKAQVMASSGRLCSKCCTQGFMLFIVLLFVGKIQGAGYSAFWIISPFLLLAGLILSCLGCAIFGITEVPTDGIEFDAADFGYANVEEGKAGPTTFAPTTPITPQPVYIPPPPEPTINLPSPAGTSVLTGADLPPPPPPPAAAVAESNPPPPPAPVVVDLLDDAAAPAPAVSKVEPETSPKVEQLHDLD